MSEEQQEPRPLSEDLQAQLDEMQTKIMQAFEDGYRKGRGDQLVEDGYYVRRVAELARLLGQAEEEIQRLRNAVPGS